MPVANLLQTHFGTDSLIHGQPTALPKVGAVTAAAAVSTLSVEACRDYSSFLGAKPFAELAPRTSFKEVMIKFLPRDPVPETTEMECEDDLAICNRQCEKLYQDQEAEMEEPCKLAVASEFGNRGMCFPSLSMVHERSRGPIRVADVKIDDELADDNGTWTRVIALLHKDALVAEVYLQIQYKSASGAEGTLAISPAHLVRVRRKFPLSSAGKNSDDNGAKSDVYEWAWLASQDVRCSDELQNEHGEMVTVVAVTRTCLVGAFAPLTTSGHLIVDGIVCSCYAPPWSLSHETCNASMLPVRLLDSARQAVEYMTNFKDSRGPMFTVDALWLLPVMPDKSLHPWASGLLRTAVVAESVMLGLKDAVGGIPACHFRFPLMKLADRDDTSK